MSQYCPCLAATTRITSREARRNSCPPNTDSIDIAGRGSLEAEAIAETTAEVIAEATAKAITEAKKVQILSAVSFF